jgi:hypothetical protein
MHARSAIGWVASLGLVCAAAAGLTTGASIASGQAPETAAGNQADAGVDGGDPWGPVRQRISEALAREPSLGDARIEVFVTGLLVTLRGQVDSDSARLRAREVARRNADPAMMVYDGLRVVPPARR